MNICYLTEINKTELLPRYMIYKHIYICVCVYRMIILHTFLMLYRLFSLAYSISFQIDIVEYSCDIHTTDYPYIL